MKNCDFVGRYKEVTNSDFFGREISDRGEVGNSTCFSAKRQRLPFCRSHKHVHGHTLCWSQQN